MVFPKTKRNNKKTNETAVKTLKIATLSKPTVTLKQYNYQIMQFCQVKLQMLTDTTTITTTKTIVSITSTSDDNNIDNNDLIQNNK
ncbi:hypothetical protein Glove_71g23 [Diversispora epigaea]|uniref:Uncharacterized protein n=1 Tax=Diversispora epigaea TaxID=1348612 RepID=A0A397JGL3_9GLOM|nr:hypothetical protein Glove_71g23 [Diversispora epigaea]